MRSVSELLEREAATVDLEGDHFERMLRRRDRKRRNQRVGVYTLVAAFVVASVVIGISTLRSGDETLDRRSHRRVRGRTPPMARISVDVADDPSADPRLVPPG